MKIYTKTGDQGKTSLLGGKRVSKAHSRIESYGAIDELNAHIGLLRDYVNDALPTDFLISIQNNLFTIGSNLADDSENNKFNLPQITNNHIQQIEIEIDSLTKELPELKNFILPGGHQAVSQAHVCRCICRRAEREVVKLCETTTIDEHIVVYLNRLSDYFFTLSRALAYVLNVTETPWVNK